MYPRGCCLTELKQAKVGKWCEKNVRMTFDGFLFFLCHCTLSLMFIFLGDKGLSNLKISDLTGHFIGNDCPNNVNYICNFSIHYKC